MHELRPPKIKMEAQYKVEKEKCDAMPGEVKRACIAEAKAQYKR